MDHVCGTPTKNGYCSAQLPKEKPYCDSHAVCVVRRGSGNRDFCSIYDVKVGDRVISR